MSKNNPQTKEERQDKFLAELTKLTMKYGVAIGGCGCCGSPFLTHLEKPKGVYTISKGGDDLSFIEHS
jgi:hypothetical protein